MAGRGQSTRRTGRSSRRLFWIAAVLGAVGLAVARAVPRRAEQSAASSIPSTPSFAAGVPTPAARLFSPFQQKVVVELQRQVRANIRYVDGYYRGGEPPADSGVCTDVVIRAFRAAGVDLRQGVATDIRAHAQTYHLSRPDPNIDHRRCRNLVVYFRRHARSLPTQGVGAEWQPGDIVFWDTHNNGSVDHVGMTTDHWGRDGNPTVVHHWPGLPVAEIEGLYGHVVRWHFRWKTEPR